MDANKIDITEIKDILKTFTKFLKRLGLYELFRYYSAHEDNTMSYEIKSYHVKRTLKNCPQSVFSSVLSSFCWSKTKEPYTWVIVSIYWKILILLRNGSEQLIINNYVDDILAYIHSYSCYDSIHEYSLKIIKDEINSIKTLLSNSEKNI